jgi:3-deoxy-7-phosphoheptulonate synthase
VHDLEATLEYARRLADLRRSLTDHLYIVMRAYFEKPRTTVGWKGLICDPYLDGSYAIGEGLRLARRVLLRIADLSVPVGCEFLDPITPQFLADAVTWAAIGARTAESQVHRQFASGLSIPVGFKNGTSGAAQVAIDACSAAAAQHVYFGIDEYGRAAIISTSGNPDCHVILRGGNARPNYQPDYVASTLAALRRVGLPPRLMVDASHGNSGKDHRRQPVVASEIGDQIAAGQMGIIGVMLESFLVEGRQEPAPLSSLVYGKSITDACMNFGQTATVLVGLADAVRKRRASIGRL